MGEALVHLWPQVQTGLLYSGLFLILFLFAKIINDFITPYSIDEELTQNDNVALSVSLCGYFLGVTIVFVGAFLGPHTNLIDDMINVGGYSLLGIVLLNLSHVINDKFILHRFCNVEEIINDKNAGAGAVQFGSYVASALIIAGAVHGEGGGMGSALVMFALAQVTLVMFTLLYELITPFSVHDEIERDNVAAGVAFGGTLVALGIILMKGVSGNFVSWAHNLSYFAAETLAAFIILPIIRLFFDRVVIRQGDLNHEIKHDQNLAAGLLEMTVVIGFSTIIFFVF